MIKPGDKLPDVAVATMGAGGPEVIQTGAYFAGKTVALFAVPGAFTPTCSISHLPGFRDHAPQLHELGVDKIACISVNDAFVMAAWAKQQNIEDEVDMLADGSGHFTQAIGLELDGNGFQMGLRSKRYSMLVKDGVVTMLNVEADGAFDVSSAEALIAGLKAARSTAA